MKLALALFLLLAIPVSVSAKKKPGDDERQKFLLEFTKLMEKDGHSVVPMMAGKEHEVFQLWLVDFSMPSVYEFEAKYIEPLKTDPYRSKMLGLGFHVIELKMEYESASFPKGVWDIPLQ